MRSLSRWGRAISFFVRSRPLASQRFDRLLRKIALNSPFSRHLRCQFFRILLYLHYDTIKTKIFDKHKVVVIDSLGRTPFYTLGECELRNSLCGIVATPARECPVWREPSRNIRNDGVGGTLVCIMEYLFDLVGVECHSGRPYCSNNMFDLVESARLYDLPRRIQARL